MDAGEKEFQQVGVENLFPGFVYGESIFPYVCPVERKQQPKTPKKMNPVIKCRLESARVKAEINGRIAVITKTKLSARKYSYGVQFWKPEDIRAGATCINGDMTTCEFVEILHPTA